MIAVLLSFREYDSSVAVRKGYCSVAANQERGLQCCCQSGKGIAVLLSVREQKWLLPSFQAQLVVRPNKMRGAILMRVQFPCAARDFSPRVNFQFTSTHLQCLYSPRVLSHASTSVCMLKHGYTAHTDRNN